MNFGIITREMESLLQELANLADEASATIYDDGESDGTGGILNLLKSILYHYPSRSPRSV